MHAGEPDKVGLHQDGGWEQRVRAPGGLDADRRGRAQKPPIPRPRPPLTYGRLLPRYLYLTLL